MAIKRFQDLTLADDFHKIPVSEFPGDADRHQP